MLAAASGESTRLDLGPRNEQVNLKQYQSIKYVSIKGGSDSQGDGSSAKPWATVKHALAAATSATESMRSAILVAEGTYPSVGLRMREYVDLFGGFDEKSWSRDIFAHPTILDARRAGRVIEGADHSRLDGFVITGGQVVGSGAGILCDHAAPVITNNVITGNTAVAPADFRDYLLHQSGSDGGGIACVNGANPEISHNVIKDNTTGIGDGGGLACRNYSSPIVSYNIIADNHTGTTDVHRTRSSNGGGVSCSHFSSPKITFNVITANQVAGNSDAGGIYVEYDSSPAIEHNWIVGNRGEDDGGGIYIMKSSEPRVTANIIAGNVTNSSGGGIRLSKEGRGVIKGNLIAGNSSEIPAVACVDSWMMLAANTIVDNTGGGIGYRNTKQHLKAPIADGNITWNNKGPQVASESVAEELVVRNSAPDTDPRFADDGRNGQFVSRAFLPSRFMTTLAVKDDLTPGAWSGRAIEVDGHWTVIASNDAHTLSLWGDVTSKGMTLGGGEYRILGTYTPASGSPGAGGVNPLEWGQK
jgi:hypothetical protein